MYNEGISVNGLLIDLGVETTSCRSPARGSPTATPVAGRENSKQY